MFLQDGPKTIHPLQIPLDTREIDIKTSDQSIVFYEFLNSLSILATCLEKS